jgi:putative hydrolase of the HAD superfamily
MEALFSEFTQDHPDVRRFAETGPAFKREVWEQGLAALGRPVSAEEAEKLTEAFRDARGRHMTTYEEVPAALEALRSRYLLGVVTNGPSDLQRLKLSATALASFFSAVAISGEVGQGKPSPEPLYAALRALDVEPASALMVGDSLPRDVAGAKAAGVPVARIERGERAVEPGDESLVPDRVIADLWSLS